jgi:hypothetical protein
MKRPTRSSDPAVDTLGGEYRRPVGRQGVPLDESRLSAFRTAQFARDNAAECVRPVRFTAGPATAFDPH